MIILLFLFQSLPFKWKITLFSFALYRMGGKAKIRIWEKKYIEKKIDFWNKMRNKKELRSLLIFIERVVTKI